jgi:thymidine phosphorylase
MVLLSGLEGTAESARSRVLGALESGEGLETFRRNVEAQGGDPSVCDRPAEVLSASQVREVRVESPRSGFITGVDAAEIGFAVAAVGGGRVRVEDEIDAAVGYLAEARIGDELRAGDALGVLLCRDEAQAARASERIRQAYALGDEPPAEPFQLIKDTIVE